MEKTELAFIVRLKVWEDTPKVRQDFHARLVKICGLSFGEVEVEDANDLGV